MRILVLGAGGFIGRQVMAELLAAGHDVIGTARSSAGLAGAFPGARIIAADLAQMTDPADWTELLAGVDAVVNAAGVLRGADMTAVHVTMPQALHIAAERAGVRRLVLISAISARADVATDYAASKLAGEAALRETTLGWTILRPSLVYGEGSYGGTSLLRGLAALPFAVPLPGTGHYAFTPIHVRDLAQTVRIACERDDLVRRTLEPVGPEALSLRDLLARYRAWLGFGRARFMPAPLPLLRLMGRVGDVVGDGPVSTNSLVQMVAGNAGDSAAFAKAIGFVPRSLDQAMRDAPAQVQDRWHARLFFLAPALKAGLVALWLVSAWLGLVYGSGYTEALVDALALPAAAADPLRIGGSLLDVAVAGFVWRSRSAGRAALVQLGVVLGYTLVIGLALPRLWLDPLGPLLKNLPVMLAIAVHGAIGERR